MAQTITPQNVYDPKELQHVPESNLTSSFLAPDLGDGCYDGRTVHNPFGRPCKEWKTRAQRSDRHCRERNWLDCIKSREPCVADVEAGHRSSTVAHLGNIARRLGRKLKWDPDKEIFPATTRQTPTSTATAERDMNSPWMCSSHRPDDRGFVKQYID